MDAVPGTVRCSGQFVTKRRDNETGLCSGDRPCSFFLFGCKEHETDTRSQNLVLQRDAMVGR